MGKKVHRIIALIICLAMIFTSVLTAEAATYNGKYWLKVNKQCNVVTVYKKKSGKWRPIRAMRCSTGTVTDGITPSGTFYTKGKWDWGELMGDVYGRYCTSITGEVLFHSVYYMERYNSSSQPVYEFNRLGSNASHGCVRLSVMDAKWIYENCGRGTKVTIYSSSKPGPLGKPPAIKSNATYRYWDPTDPNGNNPYYLLKKPVIKIAKKKKRIIQYGTSYRLKSYVSAKDPNTYMNLSYKIKVSSVKKYSTKKKRYVKSKFSTRKLGRYKITYKVYDKYSGTAYRSYKIRVVDNIKTPVISGAKNMRVYLKDKDAVRRVKATQPSANITSRMVVYIKHQDDQKYTKMSYKNAKKYVFKKKGMYKVIYVARNKYNARKKAKRTILVTVVEPKATKKKAASGSMVKAQNENNVMAESEEKITTDTEVKEKIELREEEIPDIKNKEEETVETEEIEE